MSAPVIYTLLIYSSRSPDDPRSAAEEEEALARHRALQAETSERGELRSVARLDQPTTARTTRVRGGEASVVDGPYIESKEWLVGFYLLECRDEQVALDRARQICVGDDVTVEIRPASWHRSA